MLELAPLALASAIDPILMGAVAIMLSRSGAANLLVAYLVGGVGVSLGAGVLVLLVLGQAGLGGAAGGSEPAAVDLVAGVVLIVVAVAFSTGIASVLGARVRTRRRIPSEAQTPGSVGRGKLPSLFDRVRSGESPWVAWLAGVAWGTPGAFYLAALALIARSDVSAVAAVATVVAFNAVMFALVEVPLVAFLVAPERTRSVVQRFSEGMNTHRRPIVAAVAGALGLYLVVKGVGSP